MHSLNLLVVGILLTITSYFLLRQLEKWINPKNRVKSKVKKIKDKTDAFKDVKKVNNKTNKKKIKKVNKFLNEKNS